MAQWKSGQKQSFQVMASNSVRQKGTVRFSLLLFSLDEKGSSGPSKLKPDWVPVCVSLFLMSPSLQ